MDDASGTLFAGVLTIIGVIVLFIAAMPLVSIAVVGFALYLAACVVWGALSGP